MYSNILRHRLFLRLSVFFFSLLAFASCSQKKSEEKSNSALVDKLQTYMSTYPESHLCDVYKFCFQDYFGLEHLLTDSMAAVAYIEREIAESDSADWEQPLFCYPLLDSNYYRVDINYVRKGIVPVGTLVSAMLQSANTELSENGEASSRLAEWKERWKEIMSALQQVSPKPLDFEDDSLAISNLLAEGKYAYHHSRTFNETYHQHYRIIRRDMIDKIKCNSQL